MLNRAGVIDSRRGDPSVLHNSDFEDLSTLSSEGLVKYAKKLETKIDTTLERYDEDDEEGGVFFGNLRQIQESLNQLSMVVDQMNVKGVTAHTVQYHSEKLHHFMRTFQRVKDKVEEKRNREVLFGDYKGKDDSEVSINMKRLMDERSSIYNSLNQADETLEVVITKTEILFLDRISFDDRVHVTLRTIGDADEYYYYSTANDVKQTLIHGRQVLENNVSKKLTQGIGGTMGAINNVFGAIKKFKFRNMFVLGGTIAFCICFLLWWWISSWS